MTIGAGDSVTLEYTGRLTDGTVFDTSREEVATDAGLADTQPEREYSPLTVEVGAERVIEGLEEALIGLEPGDAETVTITPDEGYGEWTDEHVREYGADEFQQMVGGETPEVGSYLETQDGNIAEITHADSDTVRVDFNHQLAGETLEFEIEILEVN